MFVIINVSVGAKEKGVIAGIAVGGMVALEALFGGPITSGEVNARAIESMRELGSDLTMHKSKSLTDIPDVEYDFVATMGCGDECPFVRAKRREEWQIPDPKHLPLDQFRETRDLIEQKVKDVLRNA